MKRETEGRVGSEDRAESKVLLLQVSCHFMLDWICVPGATRRAPWAECHATRSKD